ncbi:MAG: cobalamin B12-binding domain-containing protein [Aestuariivirga sp.]|uniref:cobalamin B12-binding domain-containing protein n=1 Tax=Aestuariivirga sp. TaxID=2650926 RepID=UPI0025BE8673|nr:cobalamin B12-binding domain-containing protein [Aestuariivirga sp.]MCA3560173.1 cobalamin B12-binding domain-containing protein [Aestuariivirga sp.]
MAQDQEEAGGLASVKPDFLSGEEAGAGGGFLPPLEITVDVPEFRYTKLSRIVAEHVLPQLVALHAPPEGEAPAIPLRTAEIAQLAQLLLGPENDDAANFVLKLKDGGVSLDDLHAELLEPAARLLGELWTDDKADFLDVTIGMSRLQRLVHVFEGLGQFPDYDEKRRVLLAAAPGEQHSLGSTIVQKFLRAGGWHVWSCHTRQIGEPAEIVAKEWFGVVGFSVGSDVHVPSLKEAIAHVRERSLNPRIGIMIGGSAVARHPELVDEVGADGTAANGPAAVILAKKLLAGALV